MRDAHKMKDKFDLSLDNRQIVSLFMAGLVVVGAVFVLGVVMGKKLASNQQTSGAPDLLAALDQKAAAIDEVRKDSSLTFQDELTKRAAPTDAVVIPPPVVVAALPPPPVAKPAPVKGTEPAVAQPPVAAEPAAARPVEKPLLAEAPSREADDKTPTRTAPHDAGAKDALKEALARAQKAPTPPAEAVAGGKFTLQLSATQTKDEAQHFAAKLKDRGYAPYIVEAQLAGKGTWFRVRMGSFPTREAASRYAADFRRETQLDAMVAIAN